MKRKTFSPTLSELVPNSPTSPSLVFSPAFPSPENAPTPPPQTSFTCLWDNACGLTFPTSAELRYHINENHIGRAITNSLCLECKWPYGHDNSKRTFKKRDQIVNHMITHIDEQSFTCEECLVKFKRKQDLLRHEKGQHQKKRKDSKAKKMKKFKTSKNKTEKEEKKVTLRSSWSLKSKTKREINEAELQTAREQVNVTPSPSESPAIKYSIQSNANNPSPLALSTDARGSPAVVYSGPSTPSPLNPINLPPSLNIINQQVYNSPELTYPFACTPSPSIPMQNFAFLNPQSNSVMEAAFLNPQSNSVMEATNTQVYSQMDALLSQSLQMPNPSGLFRTLMPTDPLSRHSTPQPNYMAAQSQLDIHNLALYDSPSLNNSPITQSILMNNATSSHPILHVEMLSNTNNNFNALLHPNIQNQLVNEVQELGIMDPINSMELLSNYPETLTQSGIGLASNHALTQFVDGNYAGIDEMMLLQAQGLEASLNSEMNGQNWQSDVSIGNGDFMANLKKDRSFGDDVDGLMDEFIDTSAYVKPKETTQSLTQGQSKRASTRLTPIDTSSLFELQTLGSFAPPPDLTSSLNGYSNPRMMMANSIASPMTFPRYTALRSPGGLSVGGNLGIPYSAWSDTHSTFNGSVGTKSIRSMQSYSSLKSGNLNEEVRVSTDISDTHNSGSTRVATPCRVRVLLVGESGVGKRTVSRWCEANRPDMDVVVRDLNEVMFEDTQLADIICLAFATDVPSSFKKIAKWSEANASKVSKPVLVLNMKSDLRQKSNVRLASIKFVVNGYFDCSVLQNKNLFEIFAFCDSICMRSMENQEMDSVMGKYADVLKETRDLRIEEEEKRNGFDRFKWRVADGVEEIGKKFKGMFSKFRD
ncbi:hypothetical protein HK098_001318 [Nowakowskiella sp. JEL0407]|nr:hypothetical protein HK098_001318 [Nowakowskiella sp. JEL0407]